ncbi:MAG: MGMT family protein [Desulfobacteraceae bacterium]|nr:MAG: MGMT family protein [Desulfobacteraceae bacterium]
MKPFTEDVIRVIRNIPKGKVLTYGLVAALAGHPGAARQVARVLHTMSSAHNLPWHRVINGQGKISLPPAGGYEIQKKRLESEGVEFGRSNRVDLKQVLWDISSLDDIENGTV